MPNALDNHAGLRQRLIDEMRRHFGDDNGRIGHSLAVLAWAEQMLDGQDADAQVVLAAAVLHDVGIPAAIAKHGSAAGPHQEAEGPPVARHILHRLSFDAERIDHVCRIIGSHHSARGIDTPEFRILWDADWLVNFPGEWPGGSDAELRKRIDRIFKTPAGRRLATETYLERTER
jgi:HD superfamily phosphodiesterase